MPSVIELLNRYPVTIDKSVDLTFEAIGQQGTYELGKIDPVLLRFIPMRRYADTKLALMKFKRQKPWIARIIGVDGEYPLMKDKVELTEEMVGSAKIGLASLMTEKDFDYLRDAEYRLRAQEAAVYAALIEPYLRIPAKLTDSVLNVCQIIVIEIFKAGQCTYQDPETGLGFKLDYTDQIPAANTPAALTGTDLWTDSANATPLLNMRDHFNAYFDEVKRFPQAVQMPGAVADAMLNAEDTKNRIAIMNGSRGLTAGDIAALSKPEIGDVITWLRRNANANAYNSPMPEFLISDSVYYETALDGVETEKTHLTNDSYVFMTDNLVEGAFVPTATNDYALSFAIVNEVVSQAPRKEKISIDTRFLGVCSDPRYLGWRKVI